MAQGLGFIEFSTGDVLSAAAANGYLASQTVMVFADAAARTAAITTPYEGMISYLKDTDATQYYSGSAWVTIGGSASPLTTKGDLYGYSTTNARVAVGTNGQVLTADSTAATGVAWATAASGGMTLLSTTTLSGASTISITGISGSYVDLVIDFFALTNASNTDYNINPNGNAGITDVVRGGTTLQQLNNGQLRVLNNIAGPLASSTDNSCRLIIANYAATTNGGKPFDLYGGFVGSDSSAQINHVRGRIKTTSAISSLDFVAGSNFTAGTVKIYGVK